MTTEKKKFPKGIIREDQVNLNALFQEDYLLFFCTKNKEVRYEKTHSIFQYIDGEKKYCGSLKNADDLKDIKVTIKPKILLAYLKEFNDKNYLFFSFGRETDNIIFYDIEEKTYTNIGKFANHYYKDLEKFNIETKVKEKPMEVEDDVKDFLTEEDDLPF